MKISSWTKKLSSALLAAGIWVPSAVFARDIPLGDASFEDAVVPAAIGYSYSSTYRPTSAWVDDADMAGQDDGSSNWLYDAAYAETNPDRLRPAPRTGNQAMHGIGYYSGQETGAVFESGMVYKFSVWAQGDSDSTDSSSRVWLYIYDGSVPFSEPNSLTFARYAPDTGDFVNRAPGSSAAESQASWTQITISHRVEPGAPEIGQPVGVAFWGAGDGAVDDASLAAVVPEPTTVILAGMGGLLLLGRRRD